MIASLLLIVFFAGMKSGEREIVLEDFDSGTIQLVSYSGEDVDPDAWELNSDITFENSAFSLILFGNTWKAQNIEPYPIDSGDVWQVSAYVESVAEIQGFGVSDGDHVIYYAFAGTQEVSPNSWIPVYQGCLPTNQWNSYKLPVGADWLSYYGYLPEITQLVYINDKDDSSIGTVYFDQILDITPDLPVSPQVTISYFGSGNGNGIQFHCEVTDPDSNEHSFHWDFGDGNFSTEQNPLHDYIVTDDHPYTVLLTVTDETNRCGYAGCKVDMEPGSSSLPVKLNFVGDIMLARKYEYPGGIIPTQGVESIFEPTLPCLGEAADITVANLECTFTTYWQHHPTKSIYFKGAPQNLDGVAFAGIDIVTVANNHILDYLEPGMLETLENLDQRGIVHSGAGSNAYEAYKPAFISKSGLNFAFLAASDRTGQYNNYQPFLNAGYNKPGFGNLDEYYIARQIDEVREISDLVIMEWHAGVEYSFSPEDDEDSFAGLSPEAENYTPMATFPSKDDREIRQFALDYGADLVICHHPHIMQAVEVYNGKLIAHSMGDFVFDLDYPETCPTFILEADADTNGFTEFRLIPVYIDHYIPRRATGELGLYILDDLAQSSALLNTWLDVDRDSVFAKVILDTLNVIPVETTHENTIALHGSQEEYISEPLEIQKEGNLSMVNIIKPYGDYEFRAGREIIWFGNMEDEGCSLWNLNNEDESYCDTAAFEGNRSISHRRDESAPLNIVTNLENRIICRSDSSEYSLCGTIKTLNSHNVTIEIQYFADRTGYDMLGEDNIDTLINGDSDWTFYYKNLTVPQGTRFFDIRLSSGVPDSGEALSWFDNVRLIRWDDWGKYETGEAIPIPNDYYYLQVKSPDAQPQVAVNYSETTFDGISVGMNETSHQPDISLLNFEKISPNPFNPDYGPATIGFSLGKPSNIEVTIFDLSGKVILFLPDQTFPAGKNSIRWNGKDQHGNPIKSGICFITLSSESGIATQRCIILAD